MSRDGFGGGFLFVFSFDGFFMTAGVWYDSRKEILLYRREFGGGTGFFSIPPFCIYPDAVVFNIGNLPRQRVGFFFSSLMY